MESILATAWDERLAGPYDVIVVGSGYGGAITDLDGDNLRIDWPGAGRESIFQQINQECFAHAKALGASFIENAAWHLSPWKTLVTAHPLGGCPMGEDGSHGVVGHFGKVFRDDTQAVHDGLYVADGSIIRSALEVNPFLTISALTERIVENIVASLTH